MYELKTTINFTFKKVSTNFQQIFNDLIDDVGDNMGENIKENILNSDKLYKPLSNNTLKARRKGVYWGKERVNPTTSTHPLIQTGSLLRSVKYNKGQDTVTMNHYGVYHNSGFTAGGANVPRRPFISDVAKPSFERFLKKFKQMLKKRATTTTTFIGGRF